MYGKMIGSKLVMAPRSISGDGVVVYNPSAELYREHGWKPVVPTPLPEAPAGWHYEGGWDEQDDAIIQTWTLTPLPDELTDAEALEILLGGDDK